MGKDEYFYCPRCNWAVAKVLPFMRYSQTLECSCGFKNVTLAFSMQPLKPIDEIKVNIDK